MSPLRSFAAARHLAASPPAPRNLFSSRILALAALIAVGGCSSAGDSYGGESLSGAGIDNGVSAGANETGNESPVTAAEQGNDGNESSGDEGPSPGSTGEAPEQEPPPGEPDLGDIAGQKSSDACDLATPVSLALRTLDAAATVSPTLARDAALSGWVSLSGIRIRPWEFFNYYSFDYPAAEPGLVTVTPHLSQEPGDEGRWTLQVGIASEQMPAHLRPPLNLTLALDNSNSMTGKAQDMLRATGKAVAASLRKGDTLSISTWNAKTSTVLELHPVSGPDDPIILAKLEQLELGGSAELYSGLVSAYKLAEAAYDPERWNRVVLVSDGGATATETDLSLIRGHADQQAGIYLSGVGVGDPGSYRSDLMDAAAHAGRGASLFIGSAAEADKRFKSQFVRTLGAAVRAIDIRLDLPPGFELIRESGQDSVNDPSQQGGALRLGPNASLVLQRDLRHCAVIDPTAKLLVRVNFIDETTGEAREVKAAAKLDVLLAEQSTALAKGAAVQAYVRALQRWQASPIDLKAALEEALKRLALAQQLLKDDPELTEIATVLAVLEQG